MIQSNESLNQDQLISSGFKGENITVIPRGLIQKYSQEPLIRHLYLTDIGFFPKASHHFRRRDKGCRQYLLIYCIDGKGTVSIDGKDFLVQSNSFLIIEKDVPHMYFSGPKEPWSIYWVHFLGASAPNIFGKFRAMNSGMPVFIPFNQNRISEFTSILNLFELGSTDQVFEYSSMLLHKLLGSFIYYSLKSIKPIELSKEDLVKRIIEFLHQNIRKSLTMKDVENEFHQSTSTLFTKFKEKTGYSIMHFYSLIKVQKACEIMNLTSLSIKEISYELDFQDPLYFSRVFKKFMGMPPSHYKKGV